MITMVESRLQSFDAMITQIVSVLFFYMCLQIFCNRHCMCFLQQMEEEQQMRQCLIDHLLPELIKACNFANFAEIDHPDIGNITKLPEFIRLHVESKLNAKRREILQNDN